MALDYKRENQLKNEKLTENISNDLPDYASIFLKYISSNKSDTTVLSYARDLKQFFSYLNNENPQNVKAITLNELRVVDIKNYERYLLKTEKLMGSTIKRRMSSIASLYKFLNATEYVNNNPMINYDYPKAEDHDIIYLNEEQTKDLLLGIKSNSLKTIIIDNDLKDIDVIEKSEDEINRDKQYVLRDYTIALLILGSALRISELVGLDINDINFEENYLNAARKGRGTSIKRVYFGNEVKKTLLNYLDAKNTYGRKGLVKNKHENALFLNAWGKRLSVRSIQLMIKEAVFCYLPYMKNKNLITPHKLRSTAATRMLFQTEDILLVSKQLDHSSPNVTAKFYAKLLENKEKEKVANLSVTNWNEASASDNKK